MKKSWVWIIIAILILLVLGYMGRHRIKTMLGGSSTPQATPTQEASMAPSPTASASATLSSIMMTKTNAAKVDYLTDAKSMTLYTTDKDTKGVSNCTGACLTTWPPFLQASPAPSSLPANVTVIKRSDGTMQYAYKGMPLYYYAKDKAAGDTLGDGVGGIWHLVKP